MWIVALPNSQPYGIPNAVTGFASSPLVAAWSQKTARGEPVTTDEHNAAVLQLAWCKDVVGARPGTVFPHYGAMEGSNAVLILGARAFEAGDWTVPAGAAAVSHAGGAIDIRTTAGRRVVYDAAEWALSTLELHPGMVVFGGTAPAGIPLPYIALGGLILAGAGTAMLGLWRRYAEETEQVRIRENAHTVRNTDVIRAAVQVETTRLQESVRAGRDIAPNPALRFPETQPAYPPPADNSTKIDLGNLGMWLGIGVATVGALGAGAYVLDRGWSREQFLDVQRDTIAPVHTK
jgi:hypothetical protein